MRNPSSSNLPFAFALVFLLSYHCWVTSADVHHEKFLQCLSQDSEKPTSISKVIYTQNNSSYSSVLDFSVENLRFSLPTTPKPLVIVTPLKVSHVQAAIDCSRKYDMEIRVRSGGHDFEGLSYVSHVPFVIIDLLNLSSIDVDVENKTAWVQAGATIGQLHYRIEEKSRILAFPAGTCPTVGVGGHFSGGGYGYLMRKYGLAADYIIDAHLIDVNGRFLDRKSMGEDLFWAIRGGGGASFGVIVAWKIKLVIVPPIVTMCTIRRTLEENATKIIHKWQYIADKLDEDLYIGVEITRANPTSKGKIIVQASFRTMFLGGIDGLLPLMQESLPELVGSVKEDCNEVSWIQSVLYFAGFKIDDSLDLLLNRTPVVRGLFKAKADYVKNPIPEVALEAMLKRFYDEEGRNANFWFAPYGGIMNEIPEYEIPFPHRAGNIFKFLYYVAWLDERPEESQRYIKWIRRLHSYMTHYVSKNPRATYLNYRDLDIGTNNIEGYTSLKQAGIWGFKYFKNNFYKLVQVKTMVDPSNFFKNEQSIPSLLPSQKKKGKSSGILGHTSVFLDINREVFKGSDAHSYKEELEAFCPIRRGP